MIPNKELPRFLKGVSVDPQERLEYEDAMSNRVRLIEYLGLNKDLLSTYDCLVMMKVETERDPVRMEVLKPIKGRFNMLRRQEEMQELEEVVAWANGY